MYMDGLGDGSIDFKDTPLPPLPREETPVVFLRFNRDSDLDGYSDRSELRLGTDPNDPASHPQPELLAGYTEVRSGTHITATLAFLNTGNYDAYGIEAVMYAPDDSVTITNNTVGGSGRVRAAHQVVVGSRILDPVLDSWRGTSGPFSGGYYAGDEDRTYTFTAQQTGSIGNGTLIINWVDDQGANGALDVGASYLSPTPQTVGSWGLQVGFLTGSVLAGDSFTVEARTPRDTFQYTINREPHTDPVIVVSYNDPQGNHRFITPIGMTSLISDLVPYSGQMLEPIGVEISTDTPFDPVITNTTHLVVNSPAPSTIVEGHLFLEFIDITGTVAAEIPLTVTLEPGPSVVPVAWDTSVFSPTFQPDEDYIVMAFWTDYQGNIIDTAARPLSSFQEDPLPEFAMAESDMAWDFGTVTQGTVLQHPLTFANTGFMDLLTYVSDPIILPEWSPPDPVSFPVGPHPTNVASDGTHVWVANFYGDSVFSGISKLRADTGETVGTFSAPSWPCDLTFDGTHIWVANYGGTVKKLQVSDGAILESFPVDAHIWPILHDGSNLWVTNWDNNIVRSIQPSDGSTMCTAAVGTYHLSMAFDGTHIWVSDTGGNTVRKLRASDCTEVSGSPFAVGNGPSGMTYDRANIWVVTRADNMVRKVRASDGVVLGSYPVGVRPIDIAFDGASVWVTNNGDGSGNTVTRLRASDGAYLGTVGVGTDPQGIIFDGTYIWVIDATTMKLYKMADNL